MNEDVDSTYPVLIKVISWVDEDLFAGTDQI
jgi:hypothetical protein